MTGAMRLLVLPEVFAVAAPAVLRVGAPRTRREPEVLPEMAFYRKYTEAMLKRYESMSMEAGRVPSLLGRELFRGNVTSHTIHSFEDVVIFCHDMEKFLERLKPIERLLIKRITLQEYSHTETASMLRMSRRKCSRAYALGLDRLTGMLLEAKMMETMEPLNCCQVAGPFPVAVSDSLEAA